MDSGGNRGRGRGKGGGRGRGGDQQQRGPGDQERRGPDPRDQGRGRGAQQGRNFRSPSAPTPTPVAAPAPRPGPAQRPRGGYYGARPTQQFEPGTSSQPAYQATGSGGGYRPPARRWEETSRPKDPVPMPTPTPTPTPVPAAEASSSSGPRVPEMVREMASMNIASDPGPSRSVPAATSTSAAEPAGGTLTPVSRPDGGGKNASKTIRLLANHFLASFNPSQQIFHYDVDITPMAGSSKAGASKKKPRISKADTQAIKKKLVEENRKLFHGALPVYDGEKNLYSPVELPQGRYTVKLSKGEDCKEKEYTVALQIANTLDGRRLAQFLDRANTSHVKVQQEFIQALDLVLREYPSTNRIIVGRSLYPREPGRDGNLGGGVVALRGFSQSLRPTAQGMALNVDFSVVAFHEPVSVIDYLWGHSRVDCFLPREFYPKERREAENALKGLKVKVTHRRTSQKFTVWRFTKQATGHLKFETGGENEPKKTISIVDYYKERYNRDIKYKYLPCLDLSKTPDRTNYVPMEFCQILEGQRYPRDDLSGQQTRNFQRMACPRVQDRMRLINDIMTRGDGPRGGPYAPQFKIAVGAQMTEVMGRVLGAPKLMLGNGGVVCPRPDDRQWNLLSSRVFDGRAIDRWGLIYFGVDQPAKQAKLVDTFGGMLVKRCGELGILMKSNPMVRIYEHMGKFSNVAELRRTLEDASRNSRGQLQILICIMQDRHVGYKNLKLICETEIGLVTQCCLFEHVAKCCENPKVGSQYLANLALKINAKVGGSNAALSDSVSRLLPRFGNSHVMYFGADVNHPGSRDEKSPSIAAVVASINWPWCNSYVAKIRSQGNRTEHIQELGDMAKGLLNDYKEANRVLPQKILFFRDGVSEGQFEMVLNEELTALKRVFGDFQDYNPTISFIVAQKRHHTRLFPFQGEQLTKSGNVPPGTVVDTVIVHPREFDFYLCSHYGLLGTSKPTHYHVLWDENAFTSDELQTLINNLCYTFARCTKPVSLVPPVYYADLAAYRGRLYVEGLSSPLSCETASTSSSSSSSAPNFPKIHEGVEKHMFFC